MKITPKQFHAIGKHPLAPRWLKVWCLKMILRYVGNELAKKIKAMTPEQKSAFDGVMAKQGISTESWRCK